MRSSITLSALVLAITVAAAACSDDATPVSLVGPDGGSDPVDGVDSGAPDGEQGSASLVWTQGSVTGPDAEKVGAVHAMAYGGGRFVAFAVAHEGGIIDNIVFALSSTDGKSWSVTQKFGLRYAIASIAWYGTTFVGVGTAPDGEGGSKPLYATSTDGSAWAFHDAPGEGTYAVAAGADRAVWGGEDGLTTTWVSGQAPVLRSAAPLSIHVDALCNIGSRWLATGQLRDSAVAGAALFLYSDDPSNGGAWTAAKEPETATRVGSVFRGMYCDDGIQVAVGAGKDVFVSRDRGESWASAVKEGDGTTWTGIQKAGGKLVLVGWKGVYGVTTDGSDLATGTIGVERDFGSAASNGSLVVTASTGNYNDHVPTVFYWATP